jgi:hypothetical protein
VGKYLKSAKCDQRAGSCICDSAMKLNDKMNPTTNNAAPLIRRDWANMPWAPESLARNHALRPALRHPACYIRRDLAVNQRTAFDVDYAGRHGFRKQKKKSPCVSLATVPIGEDCCKGERRALR